MQNLNENVAQSTGPENQQKIVDSKLELINETLAKSMTEYETKCRAFFRLMLDLPTALYCIDVLVNQQVGGACGTAASCISIYEIVNK